MPPIEENESEPLHELRRLHEDSKFASGKMAVFQYVAIAIFVLLVSRFWDLQVRNPGVYQEMADANRIRSVPVLAPRGKILDRDGRVIVDNHSSFTVLLNRETLKPEHLKDIAEGLDLDYGQLVSRLAKFRNRPAY
ncbi:MAG: penicillin-binding protein 2, partial [Bryobacteraceae bacterium]